MWIASSRSHTRTSRSTVMRKRPHRTLLLPSGPSYYPLAACVMSISDLNSLRQKVSPSLELSSQALQSEGS
eukprot:3012481-Amphidinium_carterae.2